MHPSFSRAFSHVLLALLCAMAPVSSAHSEDATEAAIDLVQLLAETQKQSADIDKLTMVWWMPEEFWMATFAGDPTMNVAAIEEFLGVIRPYLAIAAVDGTVGPFGGADFVAKDVLESSIQLIDYEGNRYSPLDDDDVSPDAINLSHMMTPVLANMIGRMGENMHVFFFRAMTPDGKTIAEASVYGGFAVEIAGEAFKWKLPLGSVLPQKICPEDGEVLSGAWSYCPWHGKELAVKETEE